MTTTLAVPTGAHLPVVEELPDFETWKQDGAARFRRYETAEVALEKIQWEVGDWLVQGEQFGQKAYEEAEQITGWQRDTLYNVVWVTKKFPISLRSETGLKWSHFKELARIKQKDVREEVLRQLNDGFEHTVDEVRERVDKAVKDIEQESGKPNEKPDEQPNFVSLQVLLKPDVRDQIKEYAKAKHTPADVLLGKIVTDYFTRNKKEVQGAIASKAPRKKPKLRQKGQNSRRAKVR